MMLIIVFVLVVMLALAAWCAVKLTRAGAEPAAEVAPMKIALERRMREGAEFRL